MPTQIPLQPSLSSAKRLPAARALFLAANYLICLALWSIGRAIFRVAANFLPALREGRGAALSPLARGEGLRGLFGRGDGRLLPAEARGVGAVDQGLGTLARQVFEPVDPGVDVVFPHLARHLVEELDAVAVRVVDVDAVRHAMIDPPVELDAPALQEPELLEPGLAVRHRQRHVIDRDLAVGQHPVSGRGQVRALDQRDGVMGQLAVIDRTVKAHLRRVRAIGPLVQLADLLEADDLGPEFVRLVNVADVQHEVVDAGRAHRLGRGIGIRLSHSDLPKSVGYLVLRLAGSGKRYAAIAGVTERRTSTTFCAERPRKSGAPPPSASTSRNASGAMMRTVPRTSAPRRRKASGNSPTVGPTTVTRAAGFARANRSSSVSLTRLEPVISTTSASGITVRASSAGRKNGSSSGFKVAGFCSSIM